MAFVEETGFLMAIVIVMVASWTTVAFVEETTLLVQVVQI